MSDKPEKIWLIQMDDYNLVWCDSPDPTNGETIPDEDRTEYLRADLAKSSEWISVETELPEVDRKVLILGNRRYHHFGYITERGMWMVKLIGGYQLCESVTHWQPLPSPPTRETP